MAKLIRTKQPNELFGYIEVWDLANGLSFSDHEGEPDERPGDGLTHSVFIRSESGDVADQVYEIFKQDRRFTLKLILAMTWCIEIPAEQVEDFMAAVEKLDVSKLKPGVTH